MYFPHMWDFASKPTLLLFILYIVGLTLVNICFLERDLLSRSFSTFEWLSKLLTYKIAIDITK